jgi:hypothetical protein
MNKKIFFLLALTSFVTLIIFFTTKKNDAESTIAANANLSEQSTPTIAGTHTEPTQPHLANTMQPKAPKSLTKITDALVRRYQAVSDNPQYPTIEERVTALEQLYPEQTIDPEKVVDALSKPTAWKETASKTTVGKELLLTPTEIQDGREFIEIDRERIAVMLAGDKIELPISDLGGAVPIVIDSVLDEGGNTLTWNGHVQDAKEFMRVTITQGDGISVGLIETEKGSYTLQSHDSKGWIASNKVLIRHDPADGLLTEHDHSETDHQH